MANVDPDDDSNDIVGEVGSIATILQVDTDDLPGAIALCYAKAKNELAEKIDSHLPDIYARVPFAGLTYYQWFQQYGFTYNQTDEIRELIRPLTIDDVAGSYTPTQILAAVDANKKIQIPTIITTFAALFIKRAYIRTSSNMKASMNSAYKPFADEILFWDGEAEKRWRECKRRLWIDFYKIGQVIDTERTRIKQRTMRRS